MFIVENELSVCINFQTHKKIADLRLSSKTRFHAENLLENIALSPYLTSSTVVC